MHYKIMKRSGIMENFNINKIINTITKSNKDVKNKINKEEICELANNIFKQLTKKSNLLTVEDVQKSIEENLIQKGFFEVAKSYITYQKVHIERKKAAQKLMNPLLKPLLGVPGVSALANIANMQSTDAAAGMVKELVDEGKLTDKERSVIITYQTSGSAFVTNYFSSGAAAFSILLAPIIVPLLVIFVFKIVGANLMRLYFKFIGQ